MQQCEALVRLELRDNVLAAAGAKALVEGARWSKQCRDLDLRGNKTRGRFPFGRDQGLSTAITRAREAVQLRVQL